MDKIKITIKAIYNKIIVDNYTNFILTVIAIVLCLNVIVIGDGLASISYRVNWLETVNAEISGNVSRGLRGIEEELTTIRINYEVYELGKR